MSGASGMRGGAALSGGAGHGGQPIVLRPAAAELRLDQQQVMRYLGYRPGITRLTDRETDLVARGIDLTLEAARPAVSFTEQEILLEGDSVITRLPGVFWRSHTLAVLLRKSREVMLVAATLGSGVEKLTADLFAREEYGLATVVDGVGTALVHALTVHLGSHLQAERPGCLLTPLYGPGYGDWPLTDNRALAEAAGGPAIGLAVTESHYLTPQKSLVGLMGWLTGPNVGRQRPEGCALCAKRDCAFRDVE